MKKKTDLDEFNEIVAKMAENRERYYDSADMSAKRDQMVREGIAKYGGITEFLHHLYDEWLDTRMAADELWEHSERIQRDYANEIEAEKKMKGV